jgi:hypothetical protein
MANEAATVGMPTQPTRVMSRTEVGHVEEFLHQLDLLLAEIPVWVSHAEITIAKAGQCGPEDDLGTVLVSVDYASEEQHVHFKPTGS